MATDVHQHLWPEPLLHALSVRREPPMLARGARGWTLRLRGEPEALVDLADHDPDRRAALARADGLGRVLIAPSVPLGIEALPAGEAEPLLAAYHEGVAALPAPFGAWAAIGVHRPDPAALTRLLDGGFAGACVGADALAEPVGDERLGPLLETLERSGAPLLIHPGPAGAPSGAPHWWGALTGYVAAMHTAWYAFAAWGRPAHPRLRVCFAMLAGLAPLHRERLTARGGRAVADPARSSTSRPTATAPSTPWCGRSASISSSSAPTGPSSRRASCRSATRCASRSASATPSGCCARPAWRPRHEPRPRAAARPRDPDRGGARALARPGAPRTPERHFEQLWRDDHVDVWVITWTNGNDTGFHDHDVSSGAVAVVEGELIEERLVIGGAPRRLHHRAGETFDFDASHVHRMHQDSAAPAVSIHAYSPPLWRMGAYSVELDGTLRRQSISYAEELRPVAAA